MEFEWDDEKEPRNVRKHGVSFREAVSTFFDPLARGRFDDEHSTREDRFVLVGRSAQGRVLVTVFTERGMTIRIISSRRATRREVQSYEEGI